MVGTIPVGFMKIGERKLKLLRVFDDEEADRIHALSLTLLQNLGVKVISETALNLLEGSGAEVDRNKRVAKIPAHLVEEALRKAPRSVTLYSRNPKLDLHVDGAHIFNITDGVASHVIDLESGERRPGCKEDLCRAAQIVDFLEYMNAIFTPLTPHDTPLHSHILHEFDAVLNNTEKHYCAGAIDDHRAIPYLVEMMAEIVGSGEEIRKRPIMSACTCLVSPLIIPREGIDPFLELAKYNVPISIVSMPILGATAPVTAAGSILIGNALILACLTILELANPGLPVMYGSFPLTQDMRRGGNSGASPEALLVIAGHNQMGRYYGLPVYSGGTTTASKLPDAQSAYEKALGGFISAITGADIGAGDIGILENYNTLCFEQMVIDYEIVTMMVKLLEGVGISDETLALNTIMRVGCDGHYLTDKHTLAHFRETWEPMISDFRPYDVWLKAGGRSATEAARERVKTILKTHVPAPLDRSVRERLGEILKRADKELAKATAG
ncbi:MAG: trimethylamine methyltransferase family protein [Candidatus Hadarchaeum sp.]